MIKHESKLSQCNESWKDTCLEREREDEGCMNRRGWSQDNLGRQILRWCDKLFFIKHF